MKQAIKQLIYDLFQIESEVQLSRPDSEFGDYATNVAMQLAKPLGRPPREIATELAEALRDTEGIETVEVAGPGFINIRVHARAIAAQLDDDWSATYGENDDGTGKTVVVEYPSQNMAKPYSVGHLRPGNQGWAAKQLMEATGWQVITDNHLGDYGAPFGVWVVGFLRHSSDDQLKEEGVYELGRVYIAMKQELKEEAERGETQLAQEVQQWLLRLEQGDEEAVAYSERFNEISLTHIHAVMDRLRIHTDHELGEAFFAPRGKVLVQELLAQGIATQNDDGSVIISLDEYGIETPLLVQKSNGAALYATTDLATMRYREDVWQPDRVIYAVGAEQQFYFQQLFALAQKLKIETEFIHLWFGVIEQKNEDGTREKMSSRKGVVLMEELLDIAEQKARELVGDREVSEEDIQKISLGAIKFSDFVADRRTNIVFDWETIFALSGMSGPYVQYAAVRINRILQANQQHTPEYGEYSYDTEKQLLLKIMEYPEVVRRAAQELEPHKIARYLYEMARELNRYYETTRVNESSAVERTARLAVLQKISHLFTHGLGILGIEVPEKM